MHITHWNKRQEDTLKEQHFPLINTVQPNLGCNLKINQVLLVVKKIFVYKGRKVYNIQVNIGSGIFYIYLIILPGWLYPLPFVVPSGATPDVK